MADKRKNNGGNSTKSNRPDDKRKNLARNLIEQYIQEDFNYPKFKKLLDKLYTDGLQGDSKSAQLFLSYMVGKPKETKDIKVEIDKNFPDWLDES